MTITAQRVAALIATDSIRILWRSDNLISARVRDANGIFDVQWVILSGAPRSSCTCRPMGVHEGQCDHVAAVLRITRSALTEGGEPDSV